MNSVSYLSYNLDSLNFQLGHKGLTVSMVKSGNTVKFLFNLQSMQQPQHAVFTFKTR